MKGVTTTIIDYILVQGEGEYMNGVTTTIIDRNGSGNMRLPVQGGFTTNSVFATKFKFSYPYIFAS